MSSKSTTVLRYGQLDQHLSSAGGFGKLSVGEGIRQNLSQTSPYVRVIICYQDIHRCVFDLKPLYRTGKEINISENRD